MKIDIDTIKKEFANCNGKKYGFALTIGIRKSGTNNSLGSMFRIFLDDGDFVALFTQRYGISRKQQKQKSVIIRNKKPTTLQKDSGRTN